MEVNTILFIYAQLRKMKEFVTVIIHAEDSDVVALSCFPWI